VEVAKKTLLFDANSIRARVEEIGRKISEDHPDGNLLLIGILKGSFVFLADLARSLADPCQIDFARISSYGSGTVSTGELKVIMDVGISVKDRNVILVDDIVDSGLTLSEFRHRIESNGPKSLKIAAMIDKTSRREKHVRLDYCGFKVAEGFLVGYGLDWDENFRNLDGIYVID
jgi:hypoxanthine phosphoribosyltransferase